MAVTGGSQASSSYLKSEAYVQELFPGIPNEITLEHISTKLSWRDSFLLSAVSRGWCDVVRSHQVYHARGRSHLTETLFLVDWKSWIGLYSLKDNSLHLLPLITNLEAGHPENRLIDYEFISLDNKVYVFANRSGEVFMLDVVGQQRWEQCASMPNPRNKLKCEVLNGKVYVFGKDQFYFGPEVYDPKNNTWSSLRHIPSRPCDLRVAAMGDELLVYSHRCLHADYNKRRRLRSKRHAECLLLYNPAKDEWRKVKSVGRHQHVVIAQGKFYSVSTQNVKAYDDQGKTWTDLHLFSFERFGPANLPERVNIHSAFLARVLLGNVVAVDHELLASVSSEALGGSCLVRSRGFGSQNKELVWQEVEFSPPLGWESRVRPIRL